MSVLDGIVVVLIVIAGVMGMIAVGYFLGGN